MEKNSIIRGQTNKLVLRLKAKLVEEGISLDEIEVLTGLKSSNISRVLSDKNKHIPNLTTLLLIANVVNMKLDFIKN